LIPGVTHNVQLLGCMYVRFEMKTKSTNNTCVVGWGGGGGTRGGAVAQVTPPNVMNTTGTCECVCEWSSLLTAKCLGDLINTVIIHCVPRTIVKP
jgi:hypothetical protein